MLFDQRLHTVGAPCPLVSHLVAVLIIGSTGFVLKKPLFSFIMAPKLKLSDAGNSDVPERSREVCARVGKAAWYM